MTSCVFMSVAGHLWSCQMDTGRRKDEGHLMSLITELLWRIGRCVTQNYLRYVSIGWSTSGAEALRYWKPQITVKRRWNPKIQNSAILNVCFLFSKIIKVKIIKTNWTLVIYVIDGSDDPQSFNTGLSRDHDQHAQWHHYDVGLRHSD